MLPPLSERHLATPIRDIAHREDWQCGRVNFHRLLSYQLGCGEDKEWITTYKDYHLCEKRPSERCEQTKEWWALKDLNLRPTDYESAALTAELRARMQIVEVALIHASVRCLPRRITTSPSGCRTCPTTTSS